MRETINQKINLARHFLRMRDNRKAFVVLHEAELLVLQTSNYPYWAALNRMLDDARLELGEDDLPVVRRFSPPPDPHP